MHLKCYFKNMTFNDLATNFITSLWIESSFITRPSKVKTFNSASNVQIWKIK